MSYRGGRDEGVVNEVYDNKLRINHWGDGDKLREHKKIFYASELKMYQVELMLASKWSNSNKLRWSVRNREIPSPVYHPPHVPKARRPLWPPDDTTQAIKGSKLLPL